MRIGLLFNIGSIIKLIEGSSSSSIPSSALCTRKSEIKTSTPFFLNDHMNL